MATTVMNGNSCFKNGNNCSKWQRPFMKGKIAVASYAYFYLTVSVLFFLSCAGVCSVTVLT